MNKGVSKRVLLSLGSNIDPLYYIQFAVDAVAQLPEMSEVEVSRWYEAPAVGFAGPAFVNCSLIGQWRGPLDELKRLLREIEDQAARDRSQPRFSNRTLDIDVVLFGNEVCPEGSGIPRDELLQEAFVLRPSAELAPAWVHPVTQRRLSDHWAEWQRQNEDPLRPLN